MLPGYPTLMLEALPRRQTTTAKQKDPQLCLEPDYIKVLATGLFSTQDI